MVLGGLGILSELSVALEVYTKFRTVKNNGSTYQKLRVKHAKGGDCCLVLLCPK